MHPALVPGVIGPLALRNRIVKTATFEGMTPKGRVTPALIAHHAAMAEHGVGLTTVAYGAVEDSGRTFSKQLLVEQNAGLSALADAVHEHAGAVSLQLAHCGGFSKHAAPKGPSAGWNAYGTASGKPWIRELDGDDLQRIEDAFATAATVAVDAGFDAVEVHVGHGYLLSQFLSPLLNRRRDDYGGSLANRLRFPLRVVAAVVRAVGDRAAVLAKINLSDGLASGLQADEAVQVAVALERAGAHGLVTSGGLVQRSAFFLMRGEVPLAAMARADDSWLQSIALRAFGSLLVKPYPWSPGFFIEPGRRAVDAVQIPVVALGGLDSAATLRTAHEKGYAFFALGRSLLADPDFVRRLENGEAVVSRCDHCNLCVAEMDQGVHCVRFAREPPAAAAASKGEGSAGRG